MSTILSTEEAMILAIEAAYKGASFVSPNPLVGCVVLNARGEFLQSGFHQRYGGPHAEVNALAGLSSEQLTGAHVIVTLEPCAHEGKTPSCARALARLPLARVTYGLVDPNPLVAGQGAAILESAGISTAVFKSADVSLDFEIKAELEQVCEVFLKNFREHRVFVALKLASSLDGQIALKSGESQWITGSESREYVHYLRSCYDGVMVGKNTLAFDNPSLNIRHPHIQKENKVVVLDPEASLLSRFESLKVSQCHAAANVIWCVAEKSREMIHRITGALKAAPQICYVDKNAHGELDLSHLLLELWKIGLRSILVEGGALTAGSFIRDHLVDRLYLFQAPIIMGSGGSQSWTSALQISSMKGKIGIDHLKHQKFGQDLFLTGLVNYIGAKQFR